MVQLEEGRVPIVHFGMHIRILANQHWTLRCAMQTPCDWALLEIHCGEVEPV